MKLNSVLRLWLVLVLLIVIGGHALAQQAAESSVLTWNKVAIEEARNNNARGLLMVRELAIMHTAMFDAWAQYDAVAIPTLGHPSRRLEAERTVANKREAISYAAFRVLNDLFPDCCVPRRLLRCSRWQRNSQRPSALRHDHKSR